jgi:hypothetical protein
MAAAISLATLAVLSSELSSGMLRTISSSLLLSYGSILIRTQPVGTKAAAPARRSPVMNRNDQRQAGRPTSRDMSQRYARVERFSLLVLSAWRRPPRPRRRAAAQGVTTNATRSENTIAAEAPTGMGRR